MCMDEMSGEDMTWLECMLPSELVEACADRAGETNAISGRTGLDNDGPIMDKRAS